MWIRVTTLAVALATAAAAQGQEPGALDGRELYEKYCAACHGPDGSGGTEIARLFTTPPPDLTQIQRRRGGWYPKGTVGEIVDGRGHGEREMPVWGYTLDADQIDRLATYLFTIQVNGEE